MMMAGTPETTQSPKNVVIVGGVAGGMSTATRLRRLDAAAHIIVLERSGHVSFANCGLPYFVGGIIEDEEDLTLQTPKQLFDRFWLDVRVHDEVVAIDRAGPHRHDPIDGHGRGEQRSPTTSSCSAWAPLRYDRPSPDMSGPARFGPSRTPRDSPRTSMSHRQPPS